MLALGLITDDEPSDICRYIELITELALHPAAADACRYVDGGCKRTCFCSVLPSLVTVRYQCGLGYGAVWLVCGV